MLARALQTDGLADRALRDRRVRIPIVREMLKRLAPKGDLFFLHYLDVLPPDGGDRFTQSECPLGQL